MQYAIDVILGAACILGGLAYLLRQRIKRVRQEQIDFDARMEAEFPGLDKVPYDITSVFNGARCIYPPRTGGSGE
jgi:hypothetical protein